MIRVTLLALAAVLPLAAFASSQTAVRRGVYYRNDEHEYELWIPWGLGRKECKDESGIDARFRGRTAGAYSINFATVKEFDRIDRYIEAEEKRFMEAHPGCAVEILGKTKYGPFETLMLHAKKLEGGGEAWKDTELLCGALQLDESTVIDVTLYFEPGSFEPAEQQLRWMFQTLRRSGESGLDPFLARRRLSLDTGLSYRPPLAFQSEGPDAQGGWQIWSGKDPRTGACLKILTAEGKDLGAAVHGMGRGHVRLGSAKLFPHDDEHWELFGALYRDDDKTRARAVIAGTFNDRRMFILRADGAYAEREGLIRTAELTAMSLRLVDVEAARAEVRAAVTALESARKRRLRELVTSHVEVLIKHAYLDEAAVALADSLEDIENEAALLKAIQVLADSTCQDVHTRLMKATRYFERKRRFAAVAALLQALATARVTDAVPLLLKCARQRDPAEAAAAVRALGHFPEQKEKTLKPLITLMVKHERAAQRTDQQAREAWLLLGPAFKESLHRLTGREFESAEQARAWLRDQ